MKRSMLPPLVPSILIGLAFICLIAGSLDAGSAWFFTPPPGEDPDGLYKPFNALFGWLIVGEGTWILTSIALLLVQSARPKRNDYLTFVLLGSGVWFACGGALYVGFSFSGDVYSAVVLVVADVYVVYVLLRYIVLRHLLRLDSAVKSH